MSNAYIVSALPILGHPRDSKRITMLKNAGFHVSAVAFQRDYHKGRLPDCEVTVLGVIAHRQYIRRAVIMFKSLFQMRALVKQADVVYASGLDMAFMALVASFGLRKSVVIEIGDVREMQVSSGLKGAVARCLDRFVMNRCGLLVATAPDFIAEYYRKWLGVNTPALVIENKLEAEVVGALTILPLQDGLLKSRPLRIGYFGLLRCEWSWKALLAIAENCPNIEILVAGHVLFPESILTDADRFANVRYVGEYKSPQGLPDLYNAVDLVWACYPPIAEDDWNLKWARPNRFYEACFFKRPLISRYGSSDARAVAQHQIGVVVEAFEPAEMVDVIAGISAEDVCAWHENMSNLDNSIYMYTDEQAKLERALTLLADAKI